MSKSGNFSISLIKSIIDDLKFSDYNFTKDELLMIQVTMQRLLDPYIVSEEDNTSLIERNNNAEDIQNFINSMIIEGSSKETVDQYLNVIRKFLDVYDDGDLRKAEKIDIETFLKYRKNIDKIAASTLEGNRSMLYSFYTYLLQEDLIKEHPMLLIPFIKYKHKERIPLTKQEVEIVRNTCNSEPIRTKAMFELFYSTGARVSEIANAKISEINFKDKTLFISHPKRYNTRYVLLSEKAIFYIKQYLKTRDDSNPYIFVSYKKPHKELTKNAIELVFHNLGIKSNINRPLYPHLMRHTMATHALESMQIDEVGMLLGHSNINNTRIYAKRNNQHIGQHYRALVCK